MLSGILDFFIRFRGGVTALFLLVFFSYALGKVGSLSAFSATYWMQMFSFQDYPSSEELYAYLIELRTGIPPLLSALEIYSFNTWGDNTWIFEVLYQYGLITLCVLPIFFSNFRWPQLLWCMGASILLLRAIAKIHPGNPQYYDVLLPVFLMVYLLSSEASFFFRGKKWLGIFPALIAGIFLGFSELTRPFMLALLPLLLAYNFFHYLQNRQYISLTAFLLPVLLISGGWHAKLLYFNHGQVIWSNSSGTNLYRAWSGFVDNEALSQELQEETPPLLYGRWQNLNTQIHYENSELRKRYVIEGVLRQPGKALGHLWKKTLRFTEPQTAIYSHNPTGWDITLYKLLIKGLFMLFPLLVIRWLWQVIHSPKQFFHRDGVILLVTGFISLMPIIGESGEEARFVVSVAPFLVICGLIAMKQMAQIPWQEKSRQLRSKFASRKPEINTTPET